MALSCALAVTASVAHATDPANSPDDAKSAGDIVSVDGSVFARSDAKKGGSAGQKRDLKPGDRIFPEDVVNTASNGRVKILMKDKSIVDLGPSSLFRVDHFDGKNGGTNREVEVSLPYGSMRAAIAQKLTGSGKFKVRTPSATMGVRGTEFVVQSKMTDLKSLGHMLNHPGAAPLPPPSGRGPASAANTTSITVLQGKVDMSHKDFDASANHSGRSPSSSGGGGIVSVPAGTQMTSSPTMGSAAIAGGSATAGMSSASKPVAVDATQLSSISSSSHMSDTTFQKAVTVDASSLSSSSSSSAVSSISTVVAAAVANVPLLQKSTRAT